MKKKSRDFLKAIFPIEFLRKLKRKKERLQLKSIQKIKKSPFNKSIYKEGINLIGPIYYETGIGQSIRLIANMLEESDIPFCIVEYSISDEICTGTYERYKSKISKELKYSINLWHVQMHEFIYLYERFKKTSFDDRYNIAYWVWEMETLPIEWDVLYALLDEIWCPSHFAANAFKRDCTLPVYRVPFHIEIASNKEMTREAFGLPEDMYLYLMLFDVNSVSERKNPEAGIEAFKRAFPESISDVGIVIKMNNATEKDLQEVRDKLQGYRVFYMTETLSREDANRLIELCDVYISLHRAEGFGSVLAESMFLNTPTVATGYSGNLDFQNRDTACLVNYTLVPLESDLGLYRRGDIWAEADIDDAACYIRKLYVDREYAKSIATHAKESIEKAYGSDSKHTMIKNRYEAITSGE